MAPANAGAGNPAVIGGRRAPCGICITLLASAGFALLSVLLLVGLLFFGSVLEF